MGFDATGEREAPVKPSPLRGWAAWLLPPEAALVAAHGMGGGGLVTWAAPFPQTPPHPKPLPLKGRGFAPGILHGL